MKDNHFITQIKIENFRCFDFLNVENLKRVNLIGGDNNVGKSAFLEALEIVAKTMDTFSLPIAIGDSISRRQFYNTRFSEFEFDVITYEQNTMQLSANNISISLKISDKPSQLPFKLFEAISDKESEFDNLYVKLTVNNNTQEMSYSKFMSNFRKERPPIIRRSPMFNENIDFIPSASLDERKLSAIYGKIVDMGMMEEINVFLREFDIRIYSLVIKPTEQSSIFKIKLKDRNIPVLLSSMGGGLNRYIAIVCAIWTCKDGQLFIDEVENGIHYTKYEKLWEIILKTSQDANCQVFAASHSRECIEAFSRAAEKYDHENIKYINFSRTVDETQRIVATALDSIGLEDHFHLGMDIR
jgi:AAA15 family ATPase/GTPase